MITSENMAVLAHLADFLIKNGLYLTCLESGRFPFGQLGGLVRTSISVQNLGYILWVSRFSHIRLVFEE